MNRVRLVDNIATTEWNITMSPRDISGWCFCGEGGLCMFICSFVC